VQVFVGTVPVQPFYNGRAPGLAGVDQINFFIPQNAPQGCYVPIQVVVAGLSSNTVTIAIGPNRQACSDSNPFGATTRNGGKDGMVGLVRFNVTDPTNPQVSGVGDLGLATFTQQQATGDLGFSLFTSLPPLNTCTYYNNLNILNGILGGQLPASPGVTQLDAGASISVKGKNGARALSYSDSSTKLSPYLGLLGASGLFASLGLSSSPPFLDPDTYTVSGPGGNDVGPFSFTMGIPTAATWTNRDQISSVDRTQNLNITWSGGDASKQGGLILGFASVPDSSTSAGFACLTTLDKGSFSVPTAMMANLPSTVGVGQGGDMQSALVFATVPQGNQFATFNTSGGPSLDSGLGYYAVGDLRIDVSFK